MSAEIDLSQYLDLFLQEADEQLATLEQETLKLEAEPTVDRLNVIFRAAHTLKGSSRAMGFNNLASLTHEMENLLDSLRCGKLSVTTEIADSLLRCLDTLMEMKNDIAAGNSEKVDTSELVRQLVALQEESAAAEAAKPPVALASDVMDALLMTARTKQVYHAKFHLRTDCMMKFARAFMAVSVIQDGGELLASIPDPESLEEERFDLDFELYFDHPQSEAILKTRFEGISEVDSFTVERLVAPEGMDVPVDVQEAVSVEATPKEAEAKASAGPVVPASGQAPARKTEASQTVRVDVARLDDLMNLVGELVIDRTRIAQIGAALAAKYELDSSVEALAETVGHISRITSDLQDQLMKARMLPIETVFNRFPRMVRDLAHKIGKEVKLDLFGGETELDRSVIEVIGDPLIHILRNAVDHGIESSEQRKKLGKPEEGRITVSARHQENHIVIEIEDDGGGIDWQKVRSKAVNNGLITPEAAERMSEREALNLIFASGLSTASEITEVSGRGVGMDIVRTNIQKLGGLIDVETEIGKGSRFTLRLPLTLAIIRGLLVKVAGVVYVLPLGSVVETLLVPNSDIQTVSQHEVIVIRGVTTPVVRLRNVFTTRQFKQEEERDSFYVVVVGVAEQRLGLVVDSLIGEQEVVIKSLSRFCGDVRGVSGATILGNGNVALIVDVAGIVNTEARS